MNESPTSLTTLNEVSSGMQRAATFEECAALVTRAMLAIASAALAGSRFAAKGRVVRGMVHVRPGDGYRRLAIVEAATGDAKIVDASGARLPSATAWRWVAEHACAVAVDVDLGLVHLSGAEPKSLPDRRFFDGELTSHESRLRLLRRDVTHLFVVPLRGARGAVDGMISLEADCRAAMGLPFVWDACEGPLQLLADLAAPHLTNLPLRAAEPAPVDELLPVVGATMSGLIPMLRVFAQQEEPILIGGPTGAGKSRLARWCHAQSSLRDGPFEIMDLSAIPEDLQMAELFGWKKGAFTGAVRDNPGFIARAKGGTLFIDEIDNLSPRAQAGLLHILEERRYRPLGEEGGERPANARFVVGTNATLQEAVRARRFREDLYYRINVLPVKIPPLKDRPDEVPLWARHFAVRQHRKRVEEGTATLTPKADAVLLGEPWPGNLRQLDNIVRRAYAIAAIPYGGVPPRDIVLTDEHLRHALAYEGNEQSRSIVTVLLEAASAIVREAERAAASGATIDLDLLDGMKGFVLAAATEKSEGNREGAFRLFGREKLVKGRNHHRVFKREIERAAELCRAVGGDAEFPFARMLEEPDDGDG